MPVGVLIDVLSVVLGGAAGSLLGGRLPASWKEGLNDLFGLCALCMGIQAVVLMAHLPAVVLSVILGTMSGMALRLGARIEGLSGRLLERVMPGAGQERRGLMCTAVVLFCASGTGIYGALDAGMTGDHSVLMAKAVLDFFTAMIFACQLGGAAALIGLPQFGVLMSLFALAGTIVPLTTPGMIADLKACGGILLVATGLRMMKLKPLPVADMIPAMALVMPVSAAWTAWVLPRIG